MRIRKRRLSLENRESIVKPNPDPLVLVENEATYGGKYDHWQDLTGVTYHFPNQYKGRVLPGREFVYYRGVRRKGGARGIAEYFGAGVVGAVWQDPNQPANLSKAARRWYCEIRDYVPFPQPVPSKMNGRYFEEVNSTLGWRTGVRVIHRSAYERILSHAELAIVTNEEAAGARKVPASLWPAVVSIVEEGMDALLLGPNSPAKAAPVAGARGASSPTRRSRFSTVIGRRAEEIAFRHLKTTLPKVAASSLRWVAEDRETPGWDIEYRLPSGDVVAVEVKGTGAEVFGVFELTAGEWRAAQEMRTRYRVALVAGCTSSAPRIAWLEDPASRVEDGAFGCTPIAYRMERIVEV